MRTTSLLAAVLLLASSCRREEEPVRVVVLGFDGAGWETLEPLLEAGKLPFLERLRRESAFGPLETFKPTKSPVIWTSIATGKSMAKHGILDFVFLEQNDLQVPYSNSERREPSIWQILDHFGKRSVVVNWFVTDPPDPIDGVMVSNRFRKALLLGPERRPRLRSTVHPPEVFDRLLPFVDLGYEDIRRDRELPDLTARYEELRPEASLERGDVVKDYPVYVLQEALSENVARHLYETERFDFFAAYFRMPDIVQHVALRLVEPALVEETLARMRGGERGSEDEKRLREELGALLLPFYRYMERVVESYVSAPGSDDTYFFVISDHGFSLHAGGYDHYHIPENDPPPDGIFMMKGPRAKPGRTRAMSVYDVAPTILHLFGLPAGREMDGRPETALLDLDREVRYQRYPGDLMVERSRGAGEADEEDAELDRELDEKTLEELRSLGYIP